MFTEFFRYLAPVWQWLLILLNIVIVPITVCHVLLRQRDCRIAAFCAVLIAFIQLMGAVWYSLFGINRIERRGKKLRAAMDVEKAAAAEACPPSQWGSVPELNQLHSLAISLGKISRLGFTIGNHIV